MAKRKEPDTPSKAHSTPSKRHKQDLNVEALQLGQENDTPSASPSKKGRSNGVNGSNGMLTPSKRRKATEGDEERDEDEDSTPKPNGKTLFATPSRRGRATIDTPSRGAKADRSAKRKSAQALVEAQEEEGWDNSAALAREILEDDENILETTELDTVTVQADSAPVTPSKRGRPKGAKNKRSPTPEGDLPPEERYFFQNRAGPPRVSSNIFSSLGLLSHDEYYEQIRKCEEDHKYEKAYLIKLHARAFPQWKFEMDQGFNVCMYGYGSKRELANKFIEWLHPKLVAQSRIVVLNGYTSRINLRNVLVTMGSALVGKDEEMKLVGQPHDMVDTILSYLTHQVKRKLVLLVNSVDAPSLRKASIQSVLARLAAHPQINIVATADTPTFPILWNSTLRDQFQFLYHDCTTFAPYDVETNPVDDVNELLGRKNRRAGGKEGIGFVLRSLPENARNLYRVLLAEILTVANDGVPGTAADDDEAEESTRRGGGGGGENAEEIGIEYRTLYQKALEEFICSSDMNFRFLLKEFQDHQMLTSKRDASGTESLGVPLSREEMEAVLEDLVIG